MKICLAQISSHKGDIPKNIEKHILYVKQAIENNADLICFPELSITGYEPELAEELATTEKDERFDVFQKLAESGKIIICIGVPTKSTTGEMISMIIFHPDKERQIYSKQYLHSDEKPYFIEGQEQIIIECKGKRIAPAICYESLLPEHFENAKSMKIDCYLASVAKPERNTLSAYTYFPVLAKENQIPVLMVNSIGFQDNFLAFGKSGAWNSEGQLIHQLDSLNERNLEINLNL